MKKWNVMLAVTLSLLACERAKMRTAGQPKETIVPVEAPQLPAKPTAERVDEDKKAPQNSPSTRIVPSVKVPAVGAFEATPPVTSSECADNDCEQRTLSDEGKYEISQPLRTQPKTKELDVLFVLDTSSSMRDEHDAIAREIGKFVGELSKDVSYRFAVMLAHGPGSQRGKVGELYSENGQDLVISETEPSLLHLKFESRLSKLPLDRSVAQGEAGMLNIYKGFSDPTKIKAMKDAGFLRDKAALLVVTVADENDVCFDYEETSKKTGVTLEGTYATAKDRQAERAAFMAGSICAGVVEGQRLRPEHAVEAVRKVKGELPVVFTGIHYLEGKVPERTDKFSKDNEPGRGYLQMIELAEGQVVDLATTDFSKILAKIGDYSNFKMKFDDIIEITDLKKPELIDLTSLTVRIQKENGEYHELDSKNYRPRIHKGKLQLVIDYVAMDYAYRNNWVSENSKLIVLYSLKTNVTETRPGAAVAPTNEFCLDKGSTYALIYLHDKASTAGQSSDSTENQNREVLQRVSESCELAVALPQSRQTAGCSGGVNCWNIQDKKRVEKVMSFLVQETSSCVKKRPVVLLGVGDGGQFLANASSEKKVSAQIGKSILRIAVAGIPPETLPGPYQVIGSTEDKTRLNEKDLLALLRMNGLCKIP